MRWYQHGYHTVTSHKIIFATMPYVPKLLHPPIAALAALVFFVLLKKERRAIAGNLRLTSGRSGARLWWNAWRTFYSFCDFMVSYCYVPHASDAELLAMLESGDRQGIDRCLERGNGLVVWTAHLGNWEIASRLLELHGRRVNVARVVEQGNPAETILRDLMTNPRLNIVQLNDNPLASVELLNALRNGEIVAMQGDRVYHSFCAEAQFFGRTAKFPLGPFFLAYISGAPLLPGFVVRRKWLRYRVVLGEPIEFPHTGERDAELRSALEEAVRFLEATIKSCPTQWLNFYDFWPEGR
jgi:predicted LPLAT superfamily acyltransferase